MNKKPLIVGIVLLLLVPLFTGCVEEKSGKVVIEGKGSYMSIQSAIDNTSNGDTIFVHDGIYFETLVINKSIDLIGTEDDDVIIEYNGTESGQINIVLVNADNCTISGFEIVNNNNSSSNTMGIDISSSNNVISDNTILNTIDGIHLEKGSSNNNISFNNISNNQYGINVRYSNRNDISKNSLSHNDQYGIYIYDSNYNNVSGNTISNAKYGIRIKGSQENEVFKNLVINNQRGIYFCCGSHNNLIYSNNLEKNSEYNAYDPFNNRCDNGHVGNYWDDYVDKYPDAKDENSDGVWDTPYNISGGNQDKYPLVNPVDILT